MPKYDKRCCECSCSTDIETYGKIEICGDNVSEAIADLFTCGGTLELKLCMEFNPECGCVDRVIIKSEGPARIKKEKFC